MAQTAKRTPKKATSRNGSSSGSSASSKRGSAKRSGSRANSNGSASRTRKPASTSAKKSGSTSARSKPRATKPRATAPSGNGAVEKAKGAAHVISDAASKARIPLIAGGTALVGVAAGAVIKDRFGTKRSNNPLNRLRGVSLPRPTSKLNLSELDLDKVKNAAERVNAYSQQASDIATAMEKTRKKNKT